MLERQDYFRAIYNEIVSEAKKHGLPKNREEEKEYFEELKKLYNCHFIEMENIQTLGKDAVILILNDDIDNTGCVLINTNIDTLKKDDKVYTVSLRKWTAEPLFLKENSKGREFIAGLDRELYPELHAKPFVAV